MSTVKRTITFNDIDGHEVTEEWYFDLGVTDVMDMDIVHEHPDDVAEYVMSIMKNRKTKELLQLWRELLMRAVGKRVGNRLVKGDDIMVEFRHGGAFEKLFAELIEDPKAGADFFNAIFPANIQAKIEEETSKQFSDDELMAMSDEDFVKVAGTNIMEMSPRLTQIAVNRKTRSAA